MYKLRKAAALLCATLSFMIFAPFSIIATTQVSASTVSGLGQLDQGFGASTGTSGLKSGIAQSSGLSCQAQTNAISYAMNNSGLVNAIVAVGKVQSYQSNTCSATSSSGVVSLFSNSGTDLWTNRSVLNSIDAVKVVSGSSGPILVAGSSGQNPTIGILSRANGKLLSATSVSLSGSGLITPTGNFTDLMLGSSAAGYPVSVYAVGSVQTPYSTELLIAEYGLLNPTSGSPTLVPIKGFGNQGSGSNLYISTIPGNSGSGPQITDAALGSGGNIYITGNAPFVNSGCSSPPQLGFVLDLITPTSSSGVPGSSGTFYNNAFGGSGIFRMNPVPLSSGENVKCFDTAVNSILIDNSQAGANVDPPQVLLAGAEGTTSEALPPSSSVAMLVGLNKKDASFDTQFGSGGIVFSAGGTGSLNEADSVGYVPIPGQSSGVPASIAVAGIDENNADGSLNFEPGVSHYQLNGSIDTNFGDGTLGTSLIPGCQESPDASGCGNDILVQPNGSINMTGGIDLSYNGLAVAQLTDREVQIATSTPTLNVSGSSAPAASFTVTVSAPGNSGLVGIPGGITADFSTANGTGKAGYNYQGSSGVLTFPCVQTNEHISGGSVSCNGNLSAIISVPTIYPANATGSASFSLSLSAAKNAGRGISIATVNITYPPPPPVTTSTPVTTSATPVSTTIPQALVTTTTVTKINVNKYQAIVPGQGYLVVTSKGQVFAYGRAKSFGSVPHLHPLGKIISIATTSNGKGYWLVSSEGVVYAFGDAHKYGQVLRTRLKGVITGFATTSNDKGYWLVSSEGVVYAFGDAHKYGQVILKKQLGSIVDFLPASNDKGYWLVSTKGRVYRFGDLRDYGFVNPKLLKGVVVSAATGAADKGYWLVSSEGVVYAFGDAHNYGYYGHQLIVKAKSKKVSSKKNKSGKKAISKKYVQYTSLPLGSENIMSREKNYVILGSMVHGVKKDHSQAKGKKTIQKKNTKRHVPLRFIAIVATPNHKGYWLISSQGNIYHYGDAKFYGSPAAKHLNILEALAVV